MKIFSYLECFSNNIISINTVIAIKGKFLILKSTVSHKKTKLSTMTKTLTLTFCDYFCTNQVRTNFVMIVKIMVLQLIFLYCNLLVFRERDFFILYFGVILLYIFSTGKGAVTWQIDSNQENKPTVMNVYRIKL